MPVHPIVSDRPVIISLYAVLCSERAAFWPCIQKNRSYLTLSPVKGASIPAILTGNFQLSLEKAETFDFFAHEAAGRL